VSFHSIDDVGNCSRYFQLKDCGQYPQINKELDRTWMPD
jgi:hypothetical protein